jgi:hypothetical protein
MQGPETAMTVGSLKRDNFAEKAVHRTTPGLVEKMSHLQLPTHIHLGELEV